MEKKCTVEEKSRETFNEFSPHEKQVFITKLIHAINHDDTAVMYALEIVKGAEAKGLFDNVKFGAEVIGGEVTLS
jgi:hypothetical protein